MNQKSNSLNAAWLNYHHLGYFRDIALMGSIHQAALKLRISPSALSTQLKQLEEALGVELFERRRRRLHLTETGETVLKYANDIFRLGNEMQEVVRDRRRPGRTHVQIGALDSVPKHLLLEITRHALELGPCVVGIIQGSDKILLRELSNHRVDLLVTPHPPAPAMHQRIYSRCVGKSPLIICGAPQFAHLKKGFPKSLDGAPFIFPSQDQSQLRQELEMYFSHKRIEPDLIAETEDLAVQKLLALHGLGLVAVPEIAAYELLGRGALIEIGRPQDVCEELFLVSASRKIENPISSALFKSFSIGKDGRTRR